MDIDFGSGDVFWGVFWLSLYGAWVYMLITIWLHVFRSPELSGWVKALWTAIILLIPFVGVLLYLCIRGTYGGPRGEGTSAQLHYGPQ